MNFKFKKCKKKIYTIFFILCVLFSSAVFFTKHFLTTNNLIYNFYVENFAREQVLEILDSQKKWRWVGYTIIPIVIFFRSTMVTICLSVGVFFYDIENKLKFKQFFRVALLGEFVLVLVGYVKLGYFLFFRTSYTFEDVQQFYPLSYINFLDISNLESWLIYPIQTINLFEIVYFFVLVYGVHKLLKNNYWKSFEIVAISYGTGLVIWIGSVMFLTLNLT